MDFSREQLQMIIQCAPGYAVMYLTDGASASLTPFLYTKNAPSFSGLTEEEYLELYRNDASKVILKQDMAPAVKIIILSGYNEFDYAKKALRFGAMDYLLKPVDTDELMEAVQKAVSEIKVEGVARNLGEKKKQFHDNPSENQPLNEAEINR